MSLVVAGAVFGEVQVSLFVAGAVFRYGVHFVVQSSTLVYFVVQGSTGVVLFQYGVVFCET